MPDSAFVAYEGSRPVGVASAHGLPLAETENELALIVGATVSGDAADSATRALVAAELGFARDAGKLLSVEADEANDSLWRVLDELPAERRPDLLLLATDSAAHGARHSL